MFIKNNSEIHWKDYNAGYGVYIDIKPGATFEVSAKVGKRLLYLLGAPNWLTKVSAEEAKKEKKVLPKRKVQKINKKENEVAKKTLDQDKPKKKKKKTK